MIEKLHQPIRDKVDSNYYYRIGGYNDYQQDVGAMVREYLQAPGKGVKVHRQPMVDTGDGEGLVPLTKSLKYQERLSGGRKMQENPIAAMGSTLDRAERAY